MTLQVWWRELGPYIVEHMLDEWEQDGQTVQVPLMTRDTAVRVLTDLTEAGNVLAWRWTEHDTLAVELSDGTCDEFVVEYDGLVGLGLGAWWWKRP